MIQVKFVDGVHCISDRYAFGDWGQGVVYFYSPFFDAYFVAEYHLPSDDCMLYGPEEISEDEFIAATGVL